MSVTIRKATRNDAPRLAELWHEMALDHARRDDYWKLKRGCKQGFLEHIAALISAGETGVLVAHDRGDIVGFVVVSAARRAPCFVNAECGIIADLAVTESYRGCGVGGRLCRRALEWIRSRGLATAEVRFATANSLAGVFWERMGFEPYMIMAKKEV